MHEWTAEWTGSFPNLCKGEWHLYRDGVEVETQIPFQWDDAGTEGTYFEWSFGPGCEEQWDPYEDGMAEGVWCETYSEWLSTFAERDEWGAVFRAFQKSDWRSNSCGGCI